jgi:GNAT superfamily N-acetyltransferase
MEKEFQEKLAKVHYLKMTKKPDLINDLFCNHDFSFLKLTKPISTEEYLFYYENVGNAFHWIDRLLLDKSVLFDIINLPNTDIFVYSISGLPAGYAEFVRESNFTEILYFGLLPNFIGKGFGKHFLQTVINEAWSQNCDCIQLNTCELDHPNALPTYLKLGFDVDKTIFENRKMNLFF